VILLLYVACLSLVCLSEYYPNEQPFGFQKCFCVSTLVYTPYVIELLFCVIIKQ